MNDTINSTFGRLSLDPGSMAAHPSAPSNPTPGSRKLASNDAHGVPQTRHSADSSSVSDEPHIGVDTSVVSPPHEEYEDSLEVQRGPDGFGEAGDETGADRFEDDDIYSPTRPPVPSAVSDRPAESESRDFRDFRDFRDVRAPSAASVGRPGSAVGISRTDSASNPRSVNGDYAQPGRSSRLSQRRGDAPGSPHKGAYSEWGSGAAAPMANNRGNRPGNRDSRMFTDVGLLSFSHEEPPSSGIREEQLKSEKLESENFALKLQINLMEQNYRLGADSKALYSQLAQAQMTIKELRRETQTLRQKLGTAEAALEQHRDVSEQYHSSAQELETERQLTRELEAEMRKQHGMIQTFVEAQDVYDGLLNDTLKAFGPDGLPELAEYAPPSIGDSVDQKLSATREIISNLVSALEQAQDNYEAMDKDVGEYLIYKENMDRRFQEQGELLFQLTSLFPGSELEQLPDHISGVMSNNLALEAQLEQHTKQKNEMVSEMEQLRRKANSDVHTQLEDAQTAVVALKAETKRLRTLANDANAKNYDIFRNFFRRLTALMGPEWGKENHKVLRQIVEDARETSRSKLPMLTTLMMNYLDELARQARDAQTLPEEMAKLEEKTKHLEGILTQELIRQGADPVLISINRELENQLKIEKERRKLEYKGYQTSLENLSLQ